MLWFGFAHTSWLLDCISLHWNKGYHTIHCTHMIYHNHNKIWNSKFFCISYVCCSTCCTEFRTLSKLGYSINLKTGTRQNVIGEGIYDDGENKQIKFWHDRWMVQASWSRVAYRAVGHYHSLTILKGSRDLSIIYHPVTPFTNMD